ncbi:MAG: ureidoglycolate lyase [Spirochaetia bacterium]
MREVKLEDPKSKGFSENYGELVRPKESLPDADTEAFSFWDHIGDIDFSVRAEAGVGAETGAEAEAGASIGVVKSYPRGTYFVPSLERHGDTSETLIPTGGDIILVCALSLSGDREKVDLSTLKAVEVHQGEALIIKPGVWHYAPLVKEKTVETYVIFRRSTLQKDLVKVEGLDIQVNPEEPAF